jgi:hypothetical protein
MFIVQATEFCLVSLFCSAMAWHGILLKPIKVLDCQKCFFITKHGRLEETTIGFQWASQTVAIDIQILAVNMLWQKS